MPSPMRLKSTRRPKFSAKRTDRPSAPGASGADNVGMTTSHSSSRAPWYWRALGKLIAPWLAIRLDPPQPAQSAALPDDLPVCYVIERYGLSNTLILQQACREAGLPLPLAPMAGGDLGGKSRAFFAVWRRQGFLFGRPRNRTHSDVLARLVTSLHAQPELDVRLLPVSIFVGRAPDRQSGWFRVLFSENWSLVGRFRRFMAVLLNGRNTIVQFSAPLSLREALAGGQSAERDVRKVSRVLRVHFRRVREAVIGPDLSHRRMLVDGVLDAAPVRQAIADQARRDSIAYEKAYSRARGYAMEIAADYSHPVVRSLSFVLRGFWNKLYDGIEVHHLDTLKRVAPGNEIIYVPSHRSHIDYLLLSYLLYQNGIVPPHIAAGVNLNLPLVGPVLRRGGAFFLRRSFRANPLYSAVFSEYVASLISRGVSIEYFIEGGRSRTGRLLTPKAGMLAMSVRAFLKQPRRPVVFQPVYIGYEKVMEGKSYQAELSGKPKRKESLLGLLRAFGVLRHRYGKVAVSFGEPIALESVLAGHSPSWRQDAQAEPAQRPAWFNAAVDDLSTRIQVEINRSADVNPINLLALCLLATPKYAMAESDLIPLIELYRELLRDTIALERVTVTALPAAEIIAYGERMDVLQRIPHPLGDVIALREDTAELQAYYRNNVVHLFAASSWVACCFQNNRRMSRSAVLRLGQLMYPFIRAELFLPWTEEEFGQRIEAVIDAFARHGLFSHDPGSGALQRGPGQTDEVFRLRVLAHGLLQTFERYYIAISVLVKNGPGRVSSGELETLCHLTAQRLSLLYSQSAPEYFDKSLFRAFIGMLRESRLVRVNADNKLEYDERMEALARDAKLVLTRELRHSIMKVTPETAQSAVAGAQTG